MNRAVFLDRDGVLNIAGDGYAPRKLEDFRIYPEAKAALDRLKAAGFLLVVVTNQPDVGKRLIPLATLRQMHDKLCFKLPIDCIKVCYHTREDFCDCRKPKPGMLLNAADEFLIDLKLSFMVGDRVGDIDAGRAAGCRTVFIDHGYQCELKPVAPTYTVNSIEEAADVILSEAKRVVTNQGFAGQNLR